MPIPLACCLALLMLTYLIYFVFSSFPFSISIWTVFVFHPVFSCGYSYAVSSVSVSAATRLAYDIYNISYICILIRRYADLTFVFSSEVYDLFQLLCALFSVFIRFPPEVIFRSRVIGACPATTGCIVAMS